MDKKLIKHSIFKSKNNTLLILIGFIVLLIVWELFSITNNNIIMPSIQETLKSLLNILKEGSSYRTLISTILRLCISLSISFTIGVTLAFLAFYKNFIKSLITPLIVIFKSIPLASIIVIMIIIIGHEKSPYYITVFMTFPIIYEGIYNGLVNIDYSINDEIKLQTGFCFRVIFDVYIPIIKSSIIMSALQAFGTGLKAMVMAEFITQPNYSIGREILDAKNNIEYGNVFAWTILLVLIVLAFEIIIDKIKRNID